MRTAYCLAAATSAAAADDGLVAEYVFETVTDDQTPDSSRQTQSARIHQARPIPFEIGQALLFDGDGWIDVVHNSTNGKVRLFASRCGEEAWLRLRFRSAGMNRFGVGTKVEVFSGSQRWIRVVTAGGTGFAASGPPEVHVGLGDIDQVDRVVIHWPDGQTHEVGALDTRQLVTFTQR